MKNQVRSITRNTPRTSGRNYTVCWAKELSQAVKSWAFFERRPKRAFGPVSISEALGLNLFILNTILKNSSATRMYYALALLVHDFNFQSHLGRYDSPSSVRAQKSIHFQCPQSPEYNLFWMLYMYLFCCSVRMNAHSAGRKITYWITLFGLRETPVHYQMWCTTKIEITPVQGSSCCVTEIMFEMVQCSRICNRLHLHFSKYVYLP